jgi:hypothetical protein
VRPGHLARIEVTSVPIALGADTGVDLVEVIVPPPDGVADLNFEITGVELVEIHRHIVIGGASAGHEARHQQHEQRKLGKPTSFTMSTGERQFT